jgi:DNA helicase IV
MKEKPASIAGRIRAAREQAQMAPAALRAELRKRGIDLSKTGLHRLETIEPTNPNLKIIEAPAVILVDLDETIKKDDWATGLLYCAMTRATVRLELVVQKDCPWIETFLENLDDE